MLSGAARRAAWSVSVVVVAAGCAALAGWAFPESARPLLAGVCAAAFVLAVVWALSLRHRLASVRAEYARDQSTAQARGAAVAALTAELPAVVEQVRTGQELTGLTGRFARPDATGETFARDMDALVAWFAEKGPAEAVRQERAMRDAVMAAFEAVARTVHQMATVQQEVLDRVEQTLSDPRLMGPVMQADHAAAQMTRKAQVLLVMCGVWPAVRETRPVSLYDCVRGAKSRILEFQRVSVHGGESLYVAPPVVEGLMHSIAELLENATVYSPSSTQVVVTVREVAAGAVVEIDDAGLGMPYDVLEQATAQLRDDLDLTQLGAVPRLGLACVGRWTRELGFRVELSSASAYGGTRAVTFVPLALLTEPAAVSAPPRPLAEESGTAVPVAAAAQTPGGLPVRRSRRRGAPAAARANGSADAPPLSAPGDAAEDAPAWSPEAAAASISSVVAGTLKGRRTNAAGGGDDSGSDSDETDSTAVDSDDVPTQNDGGRS